MEKFGFMSFWQESSWGDEEEKTWNNGIAPAREKEEFWPIKICWSKFILQQLSHFNFLL
jgi:hypothetical protein